MTWSSGMLSWKTTSPGANGTLRFDGALTNVTGLLASGDVGLGDPFDRAQREHLLIAHAAHGGQGVKAKPVDGYAEFRGEFVPRHEAGVVAGAGVFNAGIAQKHNKP